MSKRSKVKNDGSFQTYSRSTQEVIDTMTLEVREVSFDAHFVTSKIIEFGKMLTGIPLYRYQEELAYRIIYSVVSLEGATITALKSRQCGKTETLAFVVDSLSVLLPALATIFEDLEQFKDGLKIGLYAPQSDQVYNTYNRALMRLGTENAQMIMGDPDLEVSLIKTGKYHLTNGSEMIGQVASKQSKIEGQTHHIVICEEAQDMDSFIVQKCYKYDSRVFIKDGTTRTIQEVVESKLNVLTLDGETIPTTYHDTGRLPCYKITLVNGRSIEVTSAHRHLIRSRNKNARKPYVQTTENLTLSDSIAFVDTLPNFGTYGNYRRGLLLGLLLGDGSFSATPVKFCGFKYHWTLVEDIVKKEFNCTITTREPKESGLIEGSISTKGNTPNELLLWLRELGIYGTKGENKFVPDLPYSREFLKGIIQGLLESDGCVGSPNKPNIRFGNISYHLVDFLQVSLLKFGVHCSISKRTNTKCSPGLKGDTRSVCKEFYELHIRDSISFERFYYEIGLLTKHGKLKTALSGLRENNRVYVNGQDTSLRFIKIKSIEPVGAHKTYCLSVPQQFFIVNGFYSGNSIEPMVSAVNGTIVKIGTTGTQKNDFWNDIQYNKNKSRGCKDPRLVTHYEANYKRIFEDKRYQYEKDKKVFHLMYEKDVRTKMEKWGRDSQAFKLSFALEWDLDSGMLVSDKEFSKICNRKKGLYNFTDEDIMIAGMDIGKDIASTVITIGKIIWNPNDEGEPPKKEIVGWVDLAGLDYDAQHYKIVDTIEEFNISSLYADYTGVGKPLIDRLDAAVGDYVAISPYPFSQSSKSDMWYNLLEHLHQGRLILPANKQAQATQEWQNFQEQLLNCQKWFNGSYLCAEKADGFLDDYVDSLGLMLLADSFEVQEEVEVEEYNPFFSKAMDHRRFVKSINH